MNGSDQQPGCPDDTCLTCSDDAVAVRVKAVLDHRLAVVDAGGGRDEVVSIALVDAEVGDTVLVHAKEAIAVLGRTS